MNKSGLRGVAQSMEVGDRATIDVLDFGFTVTEVMGDADSEFRNIFAKNEHYPREGLFTRVEFGVDLDDNITGLLVRVYDEEDYQGELVDEKKHQTFESISIVD